ncbi:MAG: UDP-N-acetylmuramoyl-L-alanine--D-glutamate ligase [Vicinamibacterales bacterium]
MEDQGRTLKAQPFSVEGKRVTVMGAARSGLAAVNLLLDKGARVRLSDIRTAVAEAEGLAERGVEIELGGHDPAAMQMSDLVVVSPGVPLEQPALAAARGKGIEVIGELELASRWLVGRMIAITGTKGKSTTTALTGRMLEAAGYHVTVGGNIGAPLSAQVQGSTPESLHVVEASSFQLEAIERFHPWIAVMMNFSPDHLDRHPTVEAYGRAKARVFENQTGDDWVVVNADDAAAMQLVVGTKGRRRPFSRQQRLSVGTVIEDGWIVQRGLGVRPLVPLAAIQLLGAHLVDDVLAAVTVGAIVGAPSEAMTAAVEGFHGLEHAMELVGERHGVRFVNDSKATNVEAAVRSIESFDGGLVPIIGGKFKGGDLRLLRSPVGGRAKAVVAIGEAKPLVREALGDVIGVHDATSMADAVAQAYALAAPSGVVLLAPACASFDMFRDYVERGQKFREAAQRIISGG